MQTNQPNGACESQQLLDEFEAIARSHGDLARLLPQLKALINRLGALEHDFAAQLQREKLSAMQALAYGASHEINNPLANIAARAQTLLLDEKDPQRRRSLATINSQAFRAHEMIADLMLFAKSPAPQKAPVDLAALAKIVASELSPEAAEQGTELTCAAAGSFSLVVPGDATQIGMAIRALCHNALQAVGHGGRVVVSFDQHDRSVELHVSDSGPGIPEETRQHLFDPFYSGREAGRGLGLGLSKVWRIMELHGGEVRVSGSEAAVNRFTLVFPCEAPADARP